MTLVGKANHKAEKVKYQAADAEIEYGFR